MSSKIRIKTILYILFLFVGLRPSYAQNADQIEVDTIMRDEPYTSNLRVMGRVYPDSIVIRWAPEEPGGWIYGNRYGYLIERTVINEEDSLIDPETFERINSDTLKPWPLDQWEPIANEEADNPYAAIAAQMLHSDNKADSLTWIEAADYLETRYSFAMLAADLSTIAAEALALRYVDREVDENKTYVYRVSSPVDTSLYTINPGFAVVNSSELEPVPPPVINDVVEMEETVELRWDRELHDHLFTAYYIERALTEKGPYRRINEMPYLQPRTQGLEPGRDIIFTDSVGVNYEPHFYRIVGITPFGELSPPSDTVMAMGRDRTPPPAPVNVKTEMLDTSTMKISWEMPEVPADLGGFYVGRSPRAGEGFNPLFEEPLPPETRSYVDENVNQYISNFYIVGVVDTAGNGNVSLVEYGKMVDSIPPSRPTGLTGRIDTTGLVHISWNPGPEKDIMGYQVYFANDTTHEFSQLTEGIWQDTTFTDSITLRTLTEKIYYKIHAVDMVYHYSEFSDILELKKPDLIPPTIPAIVDYAVTEEGIRLEWVPSSSRDVVLYRIYRKTDTTEWMSIHDVDSSSVRHLYLDESVQPGVIYEYAMESMDDDSLWSGKADPLRLEMIDFETKPSVQEFFGYLNEDDNAVELNWKYPYDGIHRYILYKSIDESSFFTYKQIDPGSGTYRDPHINPGSFYKYAMQVIYEDGKKSPIGKIVEIEYEE